MNATINPAQTQAKWTVLLYSAADNNLKDYMFEDVKEIERVGSDAYTNLVVQMDQGGDVGAARYLLQKNTNPGELTSPKLEDMGQVNMADPKSLADFVKWGMEKFPAEHYMLVISDHGNGWQGAVEDDSHGGWMTSPMLREGLEQAQAATGKKIDILGMDACLMASTEYAHEMQGVADFMVVSEQTEGADGWNYTQLLNPSLLQNMKTAHMMKINVEPRELAAMGVSSAQAHQGVLPTMSAVDTAKVPALTAAVDEFAQAIIASDTPGATFKSHAQSTTNFYGYKDLGDFANRVKNDASITDENLKKAAEKTTAALADALVAEQHSSRYPNATGLTIEIPSWGGVQDKYGDLKFAQDTHWPQALAKITGDGK